MKKLKSIVVVIVFLVIFQTLLSTASANGINVVVNSKRINYNKKTGFPEINHIYVPFKQTMKSVGCSVGYDKKKKVAIAIYDNYRLEFPVNKKFFYNNNTKIKLDKKSKIKNGIFYISFKPVMKELGFDVNFNNKANAIIASNYNEGELAEYNTGSLKTLVSELLKGNVVYKNGKYYAVPKYIRMMANQVTTYIGDDLNKAIYPEKTDRYSTADIDLSKFNTRWIEIDSFRKEKIYEDMLIQDRNNLKQNNENTNDSANLNSYDLDLDFDISRLKKYTDNNGRIYFFLYGIYGDDLDGTGNPPILYALTELTDNFMKKKDAQGKFNGLSILREDGETYFNMTELEKKKIEY